MHKVSGWIALVIGFWAHFCFISSALAEPHGVTDSETVSYGEGKSTQTYDSLLIGHWAEEDTKIIYSKDGLHFPGANGMVFVFPGTGGEAEGDYGLKMSTSGTLHELVKKQREKYAVAALQNPIYLNFDKYSKLEPMLQWQLRVMHKIKAQLPPGTPLYYIGRSTGAGLGMELIHRYMRGDKGYEIVGEFESMTFYSIEGHRDHERARWHAAEVATPGADMRVTNAGPGIFADMSFQTERLPEFKGKVPRLILSAGARDIFGPLSDTLSSIKDFEQMHPGVPFELAIHHGDHEPAKALPQHGIKNLDCLRMIFARAFSKDPLKKQGRNLIYLPGEEEVWGALAGVRGDDELRMSQGILGDTTPDLVMTAVTGKGGAPAFRPVDPKFRLPGAVPVKFQGGDYANVLETADLHELHTRIIYPKKGIWFEGATGVTVIVTGTSARIDSEYGPERSMSPVAKELINKRGQSVIIATPPIYYLSADEEGRKPYLEKYRKTEANVKWLLDLFAYVESKVPPGTMINYHGRSFGAGVGAEAFHRYMRGDAGYEIVGRLSRMLLMGVDGHTPEAIGAWGPGEKHYYLETEEGRAKADPPVVLAGPEIFGDMHWQTEKLPSLPVGKKAPKVVMATGANDEFSEPSASLRPIKDFADMHPGADITVAFHHGKHDPGAGVSRRQQTSEGMKDVRIVMPLEPLRLILENMYDVPPAGPGFHVEYFPDQRTVEGYLDERNTDQVALCRTVLGASGS